MNKKLFGKNLQRNRKKKRQTKSNNVRKIDFVVPGDKNGSIKFPDDDFFRAVYNSSPNMIHEDKYVPMFCVLCGEVMTSVHDTHNPWPLAERSRSHKEAMDTGDNNRCCSQCNQTKVLPARFGVDSMSDLTYLGTKMIPVSDIVTR